MGGSDNGSLPIRDLHFDVREKGLDMRGEEKAGRRKSGRTTAALRWAASNWLSLIIIVYGFLDHA